MMTRQLGYRAMVCAIALCAMAASTALAQVPATTAYQFSSYPMISGTVVSVNDHQMVVDTDQGEPITLELDSRTMAPRDLAPGMFMHAEFQARDDCRFYAQRIRPVRGGMTTRRLQAYANTQDPDGAIERNASALTSNQHPAVATPAVDEHRTIEDAYQRSPGTMVTATPSTRDYRASTRPLISGRVVAVNDHRLVVRTDQGQQVNLVMDSHTMVPREVAPGSYMRAEFREMKDGRYYAQRITPDGSGVAEREPAYAHTTDSDAVIASRTSDCQPYTSGGTGNAVSSVVDLRDTPAAPTVAVAEVEAAPVAAENRLEVLPQTASAPWALVIGLIALAAAGLAEVARRSQLAKARPATVPAPGAPR